MRYCSKTACSAVAGASCAFNYHERVVWLTGLTQDPHPAFYDLCDQHAEVLRVPKGWRMEDLRSEDERPPPSDGYPAPPAPEAPPSSDVPAAAPPHAVPDVAPPLSREPEPPSAGLPQDEQAPNTARDVVVPLAFQASLLN